MAQASFKRKRSFQETMLLVFLLVCLCCASITAIFGFVIPVPRLLSFHFGHPASATGNASFLTAYLADVVNSLHLGPSPVVENTPPATALMGQKVPPRTTGQNHPHNTNSDVSIEANGKQITNGSILQKHGTEGRNLTQEVTRSLKRVKHKEDPLRFERALNWTGAPLIRGHPRWQRLDKNFTAYVYSAHFDDVDLPPRIRVIGVLDQALPHVNVTCHFYDRDGGPRLRSVSGTIYHFRGTNGRKYVGAYADCPIPRDDNRLPYAVSVNKGNDSAETNYMIIHYSHTSLASNINTTQTFQNDSKPHRNGYMNIRGQDRWRWNVTRCFPAFQKNYSNPVLLAEMVAASKALGVQHFVFYVESAAPDMLKMLKVLEREGLAEVYPWNLHLYDKNLFYVAQFSAIQDCLYRHLWSSRFLLFGDIDELFVPRANQTLSALLQSAYEKQPECGAFLFRNTFYNLHLATESPPVSVDLPADVPLNKLTMLTYVRREGVFPSGSRSKPAVDPHRVLTGSVHKIFAVRKGYRAMCPMDHKRGLLHHYRYAAMRPEIQILDPFLWHFAADIVHQVKVFLSKFRLTDSKPYP